MAHSVQTVPIGTFMSGYRTLKKDRACSKCGGLREGASRYCSACKARYEIERREGWLTLNRAKFTTSAAFVREVLAILESTDYKLRLIVNADDLERLEAELDGKSTLGRLKVRTA